MMQAMSSIIRGKMPPSPGGQRWGHIHQHQGHWGSGAAQGGGPWWDVPHVSDRPIVDLMGTTETLSEPSELELDDVVITNPHIEAILENEDWVEDASGLVSHCIAILKICHTLTEKLVAMTMGSGARVKSPASLGDIIVVAKRISPR
uniref:Transmembrane protein 98 n=1 Tax=Taeniopygia guttata TaxID=59729 RepID=A0A674GVB6_TAEGU